MFIQPQCLMFDLMYDLDDVDATGTQILQHFDINIKDHKPSHFKLKSKFNPNLVPGNRIDMFRDLVINDLDTLTNKCEPHMKEKYTLAERKTLQKISTNVSINLKPADKVGNIINLNKQDYLNEAYWQLEDQNTAMRG
ncbi:hypothetical protein NDU88_002938 [Pleurodeles waltl]|uniref:Uncharacterized protein n=1 Tax=Pleurodeles waltl TaxID=8319 RepID=A0AAV7NJB8_PLEWA|nr:hypothetical protein NDU88_002938 [Pleurodeles waltl]